MKNVRRGTAALAAGALALLIGSSSTLGAAGARSATAPDDLIPLTIGVVAVSSSAPFHIAQDRGIFEKYGLEVTFQPIAGGHETVPALVSGSIDIGQGTVLSVALAAASGIETRCFNGDFRVPADGGLLGLVGREGITETADLAGKVVAANGLGGSNGVIIKAALERAGVDPDDVRIVDLPFGGMPAALESGQIDAALAFEPFVTILTNAGGVLLDGSPEHAIAESPLFACQIALQSWLDENPDAAARFVSAMEEAKQIANDDRPYLEQVLGEHTQTPPDVLAQMVMPDFTNDFTVDDIQVWVDAAVRYEFLDEGFDSEQLVAVPETDAGAETDATSA